MLTDSVLDAAGSLRRSYAAVDWSATAVGPMSSWSPALRNAVELALQTRFPVTLFWGPEFVLIYNEAYVPLIADKHPSALGSRASDVFPEAWETIGPMMESVLAGEGATFVEDASVPLLRHGRLEEAFFTFSYSPVTNAEGAVEGVLDIATETTRQVIDRRRLTVLSRLRELLADAEDVEEVRGRALSALRANAEDLPAVEITLASDGASDAGASPGESGFVVEEHGRGRVARFSLGSAERAQRPVLVVRLSEHLSPDAAYLQYLRLIASSLGRAIDRIDARTAERRSAAAERSVSEALQRSLLTEPPQPDHLEIAVRYQPATEQARLGGDWHDAFLAPDGSLTLVVGDVTGHDHRAVAAMAQVRNLLRGVTYARDGSPGRVLSSLDQAMHGLEVDMYATAILAQVERSAAEESAPRIVRWSNAGHPPPVLIAPDGRARLLETPPDALLGLGGGRRADHAVALEAGSSLVLYTDGLVERRSAPLQERLEWLAGVLDGLASVSADALCDHVMDQLGDGVDDDVALLVLRFDP